MVGPSHLFQQNYKHLVYRQFAWQCKLRSGWKVERQDKAMKFSTKVTYKTPLSTIKKLSGLSPRANYTHRETAACRRS
jgi:hypothetical protein